MRTVYIILFTIFVIYAASSTALAICLLIQGRNEVKMFSIVSTLFIILSIIVAQQLKRYN
jgi:hypothetical protein